ncbi:MAG: hypothetical protein ABSG86_27640 [Thermoguttaceae bacterium]|jgi:hypothetical protein
MKTQRLLIAIIVLVVAHQAGQPAWGQSPPPATLLEVRAFPVTGPVEGLEAETLDFRYSPERWQACIGLPDDPHKSIVGSDGSLYYRYGGGKYYDFKVRVRPELAADGPAGKVRQRLLEPRVPLVISEQTRGGLTLTSEAWAAAPDAKGMTVDQWSRRRVDYLWLRLKNTGAKQAAGHVALEVDCPKLSLAPDHATLAESGNRPRTFLGMSPPCESGFRTANATGTIGLAWPQVQLAPGEEYGVLVTIPQGADTVGRADVKDAAALRERAVAFWKGAGLPFDRITVPDPAMQGLLDSCVRNIYQAREIKGGRPAFQVGPTCYRGTWAADGPFIMEAITYLGRAAEVRAGLENQVDQDQGPGGVAFSKKCGLRLWMIWRHAQLTGDRQWLRTMWPKVQRDVDQIIQYRRMTRSDPKQANFGLMPIGFGDGGLGGEHREYTNVYWTLAGLRAAIEMAGATGDPHAAAWKAEYQDYWDTFQRARERDKLSDAHGNVYVPVTMRGEQVQLPQRGAWAFMHSIFPGRIFQPDDPLMLGTLAMLDANQREGLIYGTGWIADGVWNYAGSFYGHAHLWLGHGRKAAATLYAFANHACPLGCWREEQKCRGEKENYCGDMPHNWASAELIRLVRHLLVLERGNELHLLEGLPRAWAKPGSRTRLVEVPTSFGPIDLELTVAPDGRSAVIQVKPPRREAPARLVIHLEHFGRTAGTIQLDGKPLSGPSAALPGDRPAVVRIEFE